MELLKWELRKIWRPGNLAAILLLGAVYYWMKKSPAGRAFREI